jgi:hypothetical protein
MRIIVLSILKLFWDKQPSYQNASDQTLALYRHTLKEVASLIKRLSLAGQSNKLASAINSIKQQARLMRSFGFSGR